MVCKDRENQVTTQELSHTFQRNNQCYGFVNQNHRLPFAQNPLGGFLHHGKSKRAAYQHRQDCRQNNPQARFQPSESRQPHFQESNRYDAGRIQGCKLKRVKHDKNHDSSPYHIAENCHPFARKLFHTPKTYYPYSKRHAHIVLHKYTTERLGDFLREW